MTPDIINASFETLGALLTFMNFQRVRADKGYNGIYPPALVLFTSWGFWNLYYYSSLIQWYSVAATVLMVTANCMWLGSLIYYGRKD